MSETAQRAVESVRRRLGGAVVTDHGGVLSGAPMVAGPEQLERLLSAWRFDVPAAAFTDERAEA